MTSSVGSKIRLPFFINQTDLLAGTTQELVSPVDGFIDGLDDTVQVAVTTGGVLTVKNNAGNAVAGLSNTVADAATKGTRHASTATPGDPSRVVKKGDRIQVVPSAAFDTAGALNGFVTIATGK